MHLKGNDDQNSQSQTSDYKAAHEAGEARDELPPIYNPPQPPPPPTTNPPPHHEPRQWRENTKLGLEIVGLTVLIAYTVFSCLQWLQIRWTNRLTREALDGSNISLQQTLGKMQEQVNQMKRLADNAGEQVGKLQDGVNETHALAIAAQSANKNALEADRPWMGGALAVQDFEANKTPTFTITWVNTGKRPARVTLSASKSIPFDFGSNPQYGGYDTTPSINLVVPGQPMVLAWQNEAPISEPEMAALKSGALPFRVYTKVEYVDVRTNIPYWTHICWRYMPKILYVNGGFSNCSEYTDAK